MRFGIFRINPVSYGDIFGGGKLYQEEPRWFLGAKIKTSIIEAREAPQASKSSKQNIGESNYE
jgi:hypothetical protein